ncbi:MAG: tyrosine-type recombinase/integrase [Candidatus Babeliaceae bacterium]|nr:tyrosine-type recombinase/integrase [Candidatus Babeliaceae bacterium]
MLQHIITNFLETCKHYHFSKSAIEAFTTRLNELDRFMINHLIESVQEITYSDLLDFVTSGDVSPHVKKVRVWTLHQFFHYLEFYKLITVNVAQKLPYPKPEKNDPQFLALDELKTILSWFITRSDSLPGLRNLIIVMLFAFLGIRLSALRSLNIQDICLAESLLWVREKGYIRRPLPMPQVLCIHLYEYLKMMDRKMGPLFLSKRKQRMCPRSVQYVFDLAEDALRLDKHLHSHLLRHTAATQLNQSAGVDVTRAVLGHRSRKTTEGYVHLNGNEYAGYMNRHPYHDEREASHA